MTTELRDALHEVAAATQPPAPDALAFRRAVRLERRRHRIGIVAGAAVAALVIGGVATGAWLATGDDAAPVRPAGPPRGIEVTAPPSPVYFLEGHRLKALATDGQLHELGAAEAVLGFGSEGVWVVDDESRVVWYAARRTDDGWSFARAAGPPGVDTAPVTDPVQRAVLSADSRFLAWMDLEGRVTTYDLKADAVVEAVPGTTDNTALVDVGAEGVLLSEDGDLWVRGPRDVEVPTQGDGYGLASSLARGRVAVADRDGRTRIYDVAGPHARLVDTLEGAAELAPDGDLLATLREDSDRGTVLEVRRGSDAWTLSEVAGSPQSLHWADLGSGVATLLVASHAGDAVVLQACDVEALTCRFLHAGEDEHLRLPTEGY